jgi:hypothetical protein
MTVAATAAGGVLGLVAGSTGALVFGAAAGAATGAAIAFFRIRPLVSIAVAVGTVAGVVVGRSVIRVLCAPSGCPTVEWITGVATGLGAFVGVGLVVALATRSFDEYHEALAANRPPPSPGCETEAPDDAE